MDPAGFSVSGDAQRLELYFPSLEAGEEIAFKVIWRNWLAYPHVAALDLQSDQGAARHYGVQVLDYDGLDFVEEGKRFLREHRAQGGPYTEARKAEIRRALRGGPYYALPLWIEGDSTCWRGTTPLEGAEFKPVFVPPLETANRTAPLPRGSKAMNKYMDLKTGVIDSPEDIDAIHKALRDLAADLACEDQLVLDFRFYGDWDAQGYFTIHVPGNTFGDFERVVAAIDNAMQHTSGIDFELCGEGSYTESA